MSNNTIAQRRVAIQQGCNNLKLVVNNQLDQPVKSKTKTQMKEEFRTLAYEIVDGVQTQANAYLTDSAAMDAKATTLEWYVKELVESHKQALLDKDKQIAELQQQLLSHSSNIK